MIRKQSRLEILGVILYCHTSDWHDYIGGQNVQLRVLKRINIAMAINIPTRNSKWFWKQINAIVKH